MKECGQRGFTRTREQVCEGMKQILDKVGRKVKVFKENRPGRSWSHGFLRRHPDLRMPNPKPLEMTRASACTHDIVFKWFDAFEGFLKKQKIESADQIFNCDKSGFPLQACSSKKVSGKSGILHRVYEKCLHRFLQLWLDRDLPFLLLGG